jgi:D-3-phosphoglycerate dehydrogenase / 2-oxoglutarate reductase
MYKIGIVDKLHLDGIKLLEKNPNFEYEIIEDLSKKNLISKLPSFDGITLRRGKIDREILEKCKKLKVISRHGVGYDNVDIKFMKEKNIALLVTATTTSTSPAEHVMFMILNISRGKNLFDKTVRNGEWRSGSIMLLQNNNNFELNNKKILIVGFGRIGKKLIKMCLGFGMKVYAYDPFVDKKIIESLGGEKVKKLEDGLSNCDIISLSVPLTKDTYHMIDLKKIKMMKKSSIIINTSRGDVIKEEDLNIALNKELIYAAGLDVFSKEPPESNNPLLKNNKTFLSPHSATFTKECTLNMGVQTVQNIVDYFENKINKIMIVNL